MKKIELSKFQDFIDSSYIKEGIETNPSYWDKYFNDLEGEKKKTENTPSTGEALPKWAKDKLTNDRLKGKTADQRWDWLTNRIKNTIKDKQATKVEDIKSGPGNQPGYRILWKEGNTEASEHKEGDKYIKVYFTEMYKGDPGVYVDKKDEGGKPGEELGNGYWGQQSLVVKTPGATGTSSPTTDLPILWADFDPSQSGSAGGTGGVTLYDLFAETEMGASVINFLSGTPEYEKFKKSGKAEWDVDNPGEVRYTESPPTSKEMKSSLTADQKKAQEENAKKLESAGQKVEEPEYSKITAGEYSYNPDSFKITWDQMFSALEKAGVSKKMDFKDSNIIGVRNTIYTKNKFSNRFTDLIVFMGPKKSKEIKIYPGTTTPGPAYMYMPFRNWWMSAGLQEALNPAGVAILQPGVYEYKVGKYKEKYNALVQSGDVKVGRIAPVQDINQATFKTFSPTPIETVKKGIDIIKAETNTPSIDSFSAGSQVFKKSEDFNDMMKKVEDSGQGRIQYALIDSSNLKTD